MRSVWLIRQCCKGSGGGSVIGLLLSVTAHEFGHLICGLLTGYRFLSFTVFGWTVTRIGGRFRLSRCARFVFGQCLMYPMRTDSDPRLMICGGALMNLCLTVMAGAATVHMSSLKMNPRVIAAGLFSVELLILNVTGFVGNMLCGSETSDGATLSEVVSDHDSMICYNHIMLVAKEFMLGVMPEELPREEYLKPTRCCCSGLAEELKRMLCTEGENG